MSLSDGIVKPEFEIMRKVVCVGDAACGKTSLINRFTKGVFGEDYKITIGCDFFVKSIPLPDGKRVKLRLWDMGGDERFEYLHTVYYKGTDGAVVLFDVTNPNSFEHLANWIQEVRKYTDDGKKLPIILVGNKRDLVDNRKIDTEQAQLFAIQHGVEYIETSAKDGSGVNEAFEKISNLLVI
jgi:small GTP-binding protein